MTRQSESVYVQPDGEKIPFTELVNTENIQETGTDWFKQNGVYKRHMCLSYLPNNISVADLRALAHAEGVEKYSSNLSYRNDENKDKQSSLLAAKISTLVQFVEESKIYKIARSKIISDLADEATEKSHEPTFKASIFFRIESDSKENLDNYTESIKEKAKQIGAEVISVKEPPEEVIIAMKPFGMPNEIGDEYCISVDAAEWAIIQSLKIPQDLLDELYEDDRNPVYMFS